MKKLQLHLHGFYLDQRPVTSTEKLMPYVVYLPMIVLYLCGMLYILCIGCKWGYKLFIRTEDPDMAEIKSMDHKSIEEITFAELKALNDAKTENKLNYGSLLYAYYLLNMRTEFEPDDTFSQKTAVWVHIKNMERESKIEAEKPSIE